MNATEVYWPSERRAASYTGRVWALSRMRLYGRGQGVTYNRTDR